MKKRILALVCAMSLACSDGFAVKAAGSVTAQDVQNAVTDAMNHAGAELLKEEVKVEVAGTGDIHITVRQPEDKGGEIVFNIPIDEEKRMEDAETANKAVVVPEVENAAKDVEVKALSGEAVKTPLAKIAVEAAKQVSENVKEMGWDEKIVKVETAFVADVSAKKAGAVGFHVGTLNAGNSVKISEEDFNEGRQRIYALHYTNNGKVERSEGRIVNGVLTFDMPNASTAAIIVETVEREEASEDDDDDGNANAASAPAATKAPTVPKSPQTAEGGAATAAVIALMCAAGLGLLRRKANQ